MMLCVTHLCWIYFEYTNILSFTIIEKNMEEQLKGEERKSSEDWIFYLKEKWQPKKKIYGSTQGKCCIFACDRAAVLSHWLICFMSQDQISENYQPVHFFWDKF